MSAAGEKRRVRVDIPCDVQQIDEAGHPWALLHEATDPARITNDAIVVTGDEEDPVLARVVDIRPVEVACRCTFRSCRAPAAVTPLSYDHGHELRRRTNHHRRCGWRAQACCRPLELRRIDLDEGHSLSAERTVDERSGQSCRVAAGLLDGWTENTASL